VEEICRWLTPGNGQTPEEILSQLITTKKPIPQEHTHYLVNDVMEVNYELLQKKYGGKSQRVV
jgi:hypothetical protein